MAVSAPNGVQGTTGGSASPEPKDLGNDLESLLEAGLGLTRAATATGEAPDDTDEDLEPDDQLDLEEDSEEEDDLEPEDGAPTGEQEPPARQQPGDEVTPEKLDGWAEAVRTNARRLSEVPTAHRAEAITRAILREREAVIQERNQIAVQAVQQAGEIAYSRGLAHGAAVGQLESQFAELDEFSDEEFGSWARRQENRTLARQYQQWLDAGRPDLKPPADQPVAPEQAITMVAPVLVQELRAVPGLVEKLNERSGNGRYAYTPEGFTNLIRDVVEVLGGGLAQAKSAEDPQVAREAARRREAAATRKRLPRPDVSEGQKRKSALPNDIDALVRMDLGLS